MESARLHRVLKQHVKTDQLLGVDAVPIGELPAQMPVTLAVPDVTPVIVTTSPPAPIARPAATSRPPAAAPASRPAASPPAAAPQPSVNLFGDAAPIPPAPQPRPVADDAALPPVPVYPEPLDTNTKIHLLHSMDTSEVRDCRKCDLCRGRTQTVFGEGDADAKLLFIGEGPGENEDLQGRPFVGKAGQKLDEMIVAMGLQRSQVYIANVVKCRPPGNRAPLPDEVTNCWDYLRRQIETIQPRVIVTLGGPATKQITRSALGITAIRGIWHSYDGLKPAGPAIPVMPTFHPSYLLRVYTPENRKKVWSDLQKAMKMLKA